MIILFGKKRTLDDNIVWVSTPFWAKAGEGEVIFFLKGGVLKSGRPVQFFGHCLLWWTLCPLFYTLSIIMDAMSIILVTVHYTIHSVCYTIRCPLYYTSV